MNHFVSEKARGAFFLGAAAFGAATGGTICVAALSEALRASSTVEASARSGAGFADFGVFVVGASLAAAASAVSIVPSTGQNFAASGQVFLQEGQYFIFRLLSGGNVGVAYHTGRMCGKGRSTGSPS